MAKVNMMQLKEDPPLDRDLWKAINELIEAADYAVGVLDRYADYQADGDGGQEANPPLRALTDLEEAATAVEKLMPKEME